MSIALLVHDKGASADGGVSATSPNQDTSGANFLAAGNCAAAGATGVSITDSKFNSGWTPETTYATTVGSTLFTCVSPTVGSSHNVTASATNPPVYPSVTWAAFSGVDTSSPIDQRSGAAGPSTEELESGFFIASAGQLVIVHLAVNNPITGLAVDGGFTLLDEQPLVGGQSYGSALAYKIQATTGGVNPKFTWNGPVNSALSIFIVNASSAPAGITPRGVIYPRQAIVRASRY